jgi:hypothetical protein
VKVDVRRHTLAPEQYRSAFSREAGINAGVKNPLCASFDLAIRWLNMDGSNRASADRLADHCRGSLEGSGN